ncbi:MAG: hypothetical protein Q4A01_05255 [Coriobacteriales bacterium]|nr:hypothetical protein [Coriobacteriales bacterium]
MYMLIYLCAILAIVVIVLVVYYATTARRIAHANRLLKAGQRIDVLVANRVASGDFCLSRREVRLLAHTINLEAFHHACLGLSQPDRRRLLLDNQEQITGLLRREKNATVHAYFAYVLCDLAPFAGDEGAYGELMMRFLDDDSVYARENALKAIYSFGDAPLVANALAHLSARGIAHNQKLVADGLLTFHGDEALLAELLMERYDELAECYQNALIDYLNHKEMNTYDARLMQEARKTGVSTNTLCSIVRKIGKSPSDKNLEFLEEVVERHQDGDDWEPVAVSATGLGRYGANARAKDLLLGMVTSPNWYVRRNASAALVRAGLTKEDAEQIYAKNDRFATDAIEYELGRCAYA